MTSATLGHYRLETEIGAGSMGAVYRAVDTRLNRVVAIKLWRHSEGLFKDAARRMLKEARAASALNHPNIVIVHDFGENDDGDAFIVQEFIDGQTLRRMLASRMPLADALDIGAQTARALAAAHAAGVVHRDIKPENIMVRADRYVKVLDFGIAHLPDFAGSNESTTMETLANDLIGTPAYMPPEMMLGGTIGPAADIFSLGVVLYEMIAGQQPFAAPTAMGVMARIATETPVSMASLDPSIPTGLDALIQAMLDKNPDRRPSAVDVERALPSFANSVDPEVIEHHETSAFTVGREAQLAQLRASYARVRGGRSALVGIAGEPGIGKTTLLEAFMQAVQKSEERPIVVRVRCSENLAGSEAYLPVLEALDSLRTRGRASLDTLMRSVAPTWHAQVATSEDGKANTQSQERMKRELRAFLAEASRHAPLVWVIEDLHWADVSTVDILNYVAARFDDMRVMIVAAFRLSDMTLARHPFLAVRTDLQSKGAYAEIPLSLLSRDDVEHYLALRFPANKFPKSFFKEIHSRTEGSPLFMADLVRYLRDTGGVVEKDGRWQVEGTLTDLARELPESVRGMITRKIERVSEDDRKLLLAASVQGQEFDASPLGEALEIDPFDLEERLDSLASQHGLVERGAEVEYPDGTLTVRYRFVHVLYQNVLYGTLQPTRRVHLCGKTAKALAAHYGSDAAAVSGRLALLFEAARDFAAAGQYFFLASKRAVSLSAFREALMLTQRGLENLGRTPETKERHQRELGLQMNLALCLRMLLGWVSPELEPVLARARQLCQQLENPPELFPVLYNLGFFHMIRGNLHVTMEFLADLTAKADATGTPDFLMASKHLLGVSHEFGGDVTSSARILEQSRDLHDPKRTPEYRALFGMDPGMQARSMSSRAIWALGYPDRAIERSRETMELSAVHGVPQTVAFSTLVNQGIHLYRGETTEAIELGDRVVALCEEYEFAQEIAWSRGFQGAAFSRSGDLERGARQLGDALTALASLRSGLVRTMFLSLFAEALCRVDRIEEGLAVVDEGLAYAEAAGEGGFLHELHRIRGELRLKEHNVADAESSMRQALSIAAAQAAKSFELRAATSLAHLLHSTGRSQEGSAVLQPVLSWFTEGQGTADHVAARTLLRSMAT